jgi:hypothetical protein
MSERALVRPIGASERFVDHGDRRRVPPVAVQEQPSLDRSHTQRFQIAASADSVQAVLTLGHDAAFDGVAGRVALALKRQRRDICRVFDTGQGPHVGDDAVVERETSRRILILGHRQRRPHREQASRLKSEVEGFLGSLYAA